MHPELSSNDKIEQLLMAVRRQGNLPLSRQNVGAIDLRTLGAANPEYAGSVEKGFQVPPPADIYHHGERGLLPQSPRPVFKRVVS
jgi:hypothetical protein